MLVPNGYLAGYVFTEHADGGNIRTHRAVYFGAEDILNAKDAIGGFVGNGIPTTKSIFYSNPTGSSYSSIRNDRNYPQFLDFLDQLYETGDYDICLHAPGGLNASRELSEESIKFMKNRFNAVTWIDHGMYNGKIHRECFVADGLDQSSEYYVADLWKKYHTCYFWSPAVELIRESSKISLKEKVKEFKFIDASVNFWRRYLSEEELKNMSFISAFFELLRRYKYKGELNSLMPNKGNLYPTPLYWQHFTRTGMFYSWATDYVYETKRFWQNRAEKQYKMELKQLDKLIVEQGVFINHGYYIRNKQESDITSELNGSIVINPYFENILENMAQMRNRGDLFITTIRDLLNYWVMTDNISFKYKNDGCIYVYNNNDKPINGLSIAIHSCNVRVNGEIPNLRHVGDDTIFWFDIQPRDHVILEFPLSASTKY
jgi:hypothetical protein